MEERYPYLVVGGGLAGLMAAKLLSERGKIYLGLEKSEALGGPEKQGHQRFFDERALQFLREKIGEFQWTKAEDPPQERRKGEWRSVEESVSEEEKTFLRTPYFLPASRHADLIGKLEGGVGANFRTRKQVDRVEPADKRVVCADGSSFLYETLVWCADIESLVKAWQGEKAALLKALKPLHETAGGLDWEIELKAPAVTQSNAVVFPFRYKESKLRALGVPEASRLHWLLFLDETIADDREEIAKCVRALKRELQKEFPELKEQTAAEKIVYLSDIVAGEPAPVKSLNVLPDVLYVGPQVRLSDSAAEWRDLDRTIENCRHFEATL